MIDVEKTDTGYAFPPLPARRAGYPLGGGARGEGLPPRYEVIPPVNLSLLRVLLRPRKLLG